MFATNPNQNYYGQPQGGYMYNPQPMPVQKQPNNLTPEEINRIASKEGEFSLRLTETEALKSACNHRSPDGLGDALSIDPIDGKLKCNICGYKFDTVDQNTSRDKIEDAVSYVTDILQTIKLLYINMPADVAREYFRIIPLIERIPKLFEVACQNYAKHDVQNGWSFNNRNVGTTQLYQMLNSGGMMGYGYPQGGFYQQPTSFDPMNGQQPYGYGVPNNVPVGAAAPNAFGNFGGVQQGYVPQTNQFQYQPNAGVNTQVPTYPTQGAPVGQMPNQQAAPVAPTPAQAAPAEGATVTATANLEA